MAGDRDDEQVVPDDPLGLGGTPDPDAPSRRPRPKVISLLGEFFRMSRTTAILLVAFLMVGALYLVVRAEPVVQFGTPGPAEPTGTAPADPTEEEDGPDETTVPTSPPEVTSPSSTPGVTPDDDETAGTTPQNQSPGPQPTAVPDGTDGGGAVPTGADAPDGGQGNTGAGGGPGTGGAGQGNTGAGQGAGAGGAAGGATGPAAE